MKGIILHIAICFLINISYSQDSSVKIQYVYDHNMNLDQEIHYSKNGQIQKKKNINIEHLGCGQFSGYYSKIDTAVFIYQYDTLGRKCKEFSYSVENGIAGKEELKEECFYNDLNQLTHIIRNTHDQYFVYDSIGNEIKDSSDIVCISRYVYDENFLVKTKTMYKTDTSHLFKRRVFFRDSIGNIIKLNQYNWDNLLARIVTYEYNENCKLIYEEETNIPVYTVERQRKNKVSSYSYEYNEFRHLIKKHGIGQWKEPRTITYKYEYY